MEQEPVSASEIGHSRHFHIRAGLLVALLAILCAVVGYVFVTSYLGGVPADTSDALKEVQKLEDDVQEVLGGKLYLSLAPTESPDNFSLDVYSFDPVTAILKQVTDTERHEYLTSKISPDGNMMALASFSNNGRERTSDTALFIRDTKTGETNEVMTFDRALQKRMPSWSSDGSHLAFAARLEEASDFMVPESWTVFVKDVRSNNYAERVATGANPVFLPDGSLAVLRSDGIHNLNVTNGESTLILPYHEQLETNIKFDVSRDGRKIAITEPSAGIVRVIPVSSWAPFTRGEETTIPAHAFWPVFSPLGDYLAIQTFEWSDESENAFPVDPALAIFSFDTNEWVMSYDLRSFMQEALFISDWK